jgi:lysozyme
MQLTQEGIDLIKRFEGFSAKRYICPAGIPTIGYGHTLRPTDKTTEITQAEAERLLCRDLQSAERDVQSFCRPPLNDNQYSALVSLVFNCGPSPLAKTLGRRLNERDYLGAADEFRRWTNAGGKPSTGLKRRREEERALFLKPVIVSDNGRVT